MRVAINRARSSALVSPARKIVRGSSPQRSHPRAARYLASIRSQETRNVNKTALRKLCKKTGVEMSVVDGRFVVPEEHVLGFLEVLDRRRYELELVSGSPERFRATGRQKLDGGTGG